MSDPTASHSDRGQRADLGPETFSDDPSRREGPPPELLSSGKYEVIGKLGEGGMGAVWKVRHVFLDCLVAVKVLGPRALAHPEMRARFFREMRAAGKLRHPHIVRAYDAEQVGTLLLLVMEYVDGVSLDTLVRRKGPLPLTFACRCAVQAALGLQHAHENGIAHRDIKPANLMVTRQKETKILDFGLVRLPAGADAPGNRTRMQTFMGTPEYVAPEQATDARSADIRADIYSLGCTLYFLLAGRPPFTADTVMATILAQIQDDPVPLPEIRPEIPFPLWDIVARMMAKDPLNRYQTPAEAAQALQPFTRGSRIASDEEITSDPTSPFTVVAETPVVSPPSRTLRRRGWLPVAACALVGLLLLGLAAVLTSRPSAAPARGRRGKSPATARAGARAQQARPVAIEPPRTAEHPATGAESATPVIPPAIPSREPPRTPAPSPPSSLPAEIPGPGPLAALAGTFTREAFRSRSGEQREAVLRENGGNARSERAVANGLKFLALHQCPDGKWSLNEFNRFARTAPLPAGKVISDNSQPMTARRDDTAATAFGLLPFLAAGITPLPRRPALPVDYHQTVSKAIDWLLAVQVRSGNDRGFYGGGSYSHALATLALCEAYGLTSDPRIRTSAQLGLDYIVAAQDPTGGGWRYQPRTPGDTSVTGWQLAALRAGQMAGLTVPAAVLVKANRFLDSCEKVPGGYGYMPGTLVTASMTAMAAHARLQLGMNPGTPSLLASVRRIRKVPPGSGNIYYEFHASQLMFHLGGEAWQFWNLGPYGTGKGGIRDVLITRQDPGKADFPGQAGSFPGEDHVGGRLGATSLSLLTLQVYYRHPPLHPGRPDGR